MNKFIWVIIGLVFLLILGWSSIFDPFEMYEYWKYEREEKKKQKENNSEQNKEK